MIDDVVGRESHSEEGRGRVEVSRHSVPRVDVLADSFKSSSLMEERGADAFADDVPVGTDRDLRAEKKRVVVVTKAIDVVWNFNLIFKLTKVNSAYSSIGTWVCRK